MSSRSLGRSPWRIGRLAIARQFATRDGRPKGVWETIESNMEVFNVKRLPSMLVPIAAMSKAEQSDQRVVRLLQRAMKYLEGGGQIVPVLGAKAASAVVKATSQLGIKEAKKFNLAWLGAMAAQVNDLSAPEVAELAQELLRYRVPDKELWRALVDTTVRRPHEMGPAEIVYLMDGFRRSMGFGADPGRAVQALCQRTLDCYQDFQPRQCVGTLGSVCRLSGQMDTSTEYQVIHHLLDQWLASQVSSWETTPSSQVVSLAVSLTCVPNILNPRTEHFLSGASSWAQQYGAVPGGSLSAEDLVVLLWALKDLTPMGLSRYPELVSMGLLRIRAEADYKAFSTFRLYQAMELLLSSKHALAESSSADTSEDLLKSLEAPLVAALASQMAEATEGLVAKVLRCGEEGGLEFWQRCSLLTEAVLQRAVKLAANEEVSPANLQPMLDTLASSKIASASAFRGGCDALWAAVHGRGDASHPVLASVLGVLERAVGSATVQPARAEEQEKPKKSQGFDSERPLSPLELAERLGHLGRSKTPNLAELSMVADRFMSAVDSLRKDELLPALQHVLEATRPRINREPLLLEVVERLGDQVAMHAKDLSNLQLISALDLFADLGLPYHLLFEAVLMEQLHRKQTLSWQQVVVLLEAFAVVRIRIPELSQIYQRQRRQQELARLPTMGMVRFLSAATRLDLVDEAGVDVREMICRILAETSPHRPLPQDDVVSIITSLLSSGIVLPDMQLRHILSWTAELRPGQLSERDLATLRQYSFFLLAQVEGSARFTLQRMPVEMQTQISELLCHKAPAWVKPMTQQTRTLRAEVSELLLAEDPMVPKDYTTMPGVSLGPAGQADAEVQGSVLLLDGPEAFFRPFGGPKDLQYTPQEKQRAWLMRRLLSSEAVRHSVADFYPAALDWPKKRGPRRINWQEWGQAGLSERRRLLGLETGAMPVHSEIQQMQAATPG